MMKNLFDVIRERQRKLKELETWSVTLTSLLIDNFIFLDKLTRVPPEDFTEMQEEAKALLEGLNEAIDENRG